MVAESGDPFTTLRVIDLVARLPRGTAIPITAITERLNATHLDWLFDDLVVTDGLLQLQANWMTDYRNASGISIDEAGGRPTVTIEDSTRVDPWIVRQALRASDASHQALLAFSRRDRPTGE